MSGITIALSKGRIFDETAPLLAAAGIAPQENPETSRKLIIGTNRPDVRLVIVRASDTPTYVQYGAADVGIAGKDVLYEHGGEGLYQPLDLEIAKCRMMVAVPEGFDYESAVRQGARLRVATKYIRIAREHFAAKGVHVDLIKLYGSMELAPLVGLADGAVATSTPLRRPLRLPRYVPNTPEGLPPWQRTCASTLKPVNSWRPASTLSLTRSR